MKKIFYFLLLILLPALSYTNIIAQPKEFASYILRDSLDTNIQVLNFSNTKFFHLKDSIIYSFTSKTDVEKFADSTSSIFPVRLDEIDFEKNTLVLMIFSGVDCHSKFRLHYHKDDEAKTVTLGVSVIYGGCRAGGRYFTTWTLIPKLEEGYVLKGRERILEE